MTGRHIDLVCLPYAGGWATSFTRWRRGLGEDITVHPVDYPGRAGRRDEPLVTDAERIIADVAAQVRAIGARRCVLFGHSMGAWIAYEVTRLLERGNEGPAGLIVSAAPAPAHVAERAPNGELTDAQLRAKCLQWGGTPEELLDDPRFREPMFAHLRADLATIDSGKPSVDGVVEAPTIALAGRADTTAPSREVAAWSANTRDWRGIRIVPGGHFFHTTAEDLVLRVVREHCHAVRANPRPASIAVPGH